MARQPALSVCVCVCVCGVAFVDGRADIIDLPILDQLLKLLSNTACVSPLRNAVERTLHTITIVTRDDASSKGTDGLGAGVVLPPTIDVANVVLTVDGALRTRLWEHRGLVSARECACVCVRVCKRVCGFADLCVRSCFAAWACWGSRVVHCARRLSVHTGKTAVCWLRGQSRYRF